MARLLRRWKIGTMGVPSATLCSAGKEIMTTSGQSLPSFESRFSDRLMGESIKEVAVETVRSD